MINIAVIGAGGRMGQRILELANQDKDIFIKGAIDRADCPCMGQNVFPEFSECSLKYSSSLEEILPNVDVIIDFSYTYSTMENLEKIKKYKKAVVIGTTGFNESQIEIIKDISKEIPCVLSPNMSIGVNVFFKILEEASKFLKDYDAEIIELHHNKKKDSPSGTAVRIAEIISKATDRTKDNWVFGREGLVGERKKEELGIHAVRLGDVVGEHSVYFCGNNERLEITHRAHTRNNFASGSILAAKWICDKKSGLYDMRDVLGFKK
ncbi:4-hydroxy-tetrahydrodipicolinate reductase [bacterium]